MSEAPRRKSRWKRRLLVFVLLAAGIFVYSLQFHPEREDWPGQRAQLAQRKVAQHAPRIFDAGNAAIIENLCNNRT